MRGAAIRGAALVAAVLLAGAAACSPDDEGDRQSAEAAGAAVSDAGAAGQLLVDAERAANLGRDALARAAYDQAMAMFEAAGDLAGQGRTLLGLATLTRYGGQGTEARAIYGRAREMFERAGDERGTADVIFAVAELDRARFNNEDALEGFRIASAMYREQQQWALEAQALIGVADSERRLNHVLDADDAVARAWAIFEILGDQDGQQAADRAWQELEAYVSENDELRLALAYDIGYADQGGSRLREAEGYLGLGILEAGEGRFDSARDNWRAAREVFAEVGVPQGVFDAWAVEGDTARRLGDREAAAGAYAQAMLAFAEAETVNSLEAIEYEGAEALALTARAAVVRVRQAMVSDGGGAVQAFLDAATALAPPGAVPPVDAARAEAAAQTHARDGQSEAAAAAFADAARLYREAGRDLDAGEALLALARLRMAGGDGAAAADLFADSLLAFLAARDRYGEAEARSGLAQALTYVAGAEMESRVQGTVAARIYRDIGVAPSSSAGAP